MRLEETEQRLQAAASIGEERKKKGEQVYISLSTVSIITIAISIVITIINTIINTKLLLQSVRRGRRKKRRYMSTVSIIIVHATKITIYITTINIIVIIIIPPTSTGTSSRD